MTFTFSNVGIVGLALFAACLYVVFTKVSSNLWKGVLLAIAFLCTFIAHGLLPDLVMVGILGMVIANSQMGSRF